ncbi:MAG TPA: LLM class flavin-dependent oxidoreductase, partial [Stellaceae bacterium]|nr:LLM class flavin-dependent oxidoreductase [Stellaceae bacterium]
EGVTHRGRFHTIENTTSLPRPTQQPRPKFYVAALNTPESFEYAGRMGYSVMAIAFVAAKMRPLLAAYRQAWQAAGHPGDGEVMIAFHMFCDSDGDRARRSAAPLIDNYLRSLVDAASDWLDGRTSRDYPGYDKIIAGLRASNAAEQMTTGAAWIGTPDEIAATIARMRDDFGGFEHASLQVNFNLMPFGDALASTRLFAREVMPRFA